MLIVWLALVVALAGVLVVAVRYLRSDMEIDVGKVSEGWLAAERGNRTHGLSS
jgi:hypothetical protein